MIQVSNTYNPYTTVRDVDMVVNLDVFNEEANRDAAFYASSTAESISNLNQLKEKNYTDIKYATCESDLVMLDGSWQYLNSTITNEHIGFWSTRLSDENGFFGYDYNGVVLRAYLPEEISCAGFTIYSAESNPITECKIRLWSEHGGEVYIATGRSENNTISVEIPTPNFSELDICIQKTKEPYRRAKILGVRFGIVKQWNRDKLVSANITEEADISGETLPINELSFEVDNSTGEFNILNMNFPVYYTEAVNSATITSVNNNSISRINQLNTPESNYQLGINYATCEPDLVMLNNTFKYIPQDVSPTREKSFKFGYVNDTLSDSNGEFSKEASITYSWDSVIPSISGIHFGFYPDNYATSITISAYENDALIKSETFENSKVRPYIEFAVAGFDKLVFTFNSVSVAGRYIKVLDIMLKHYKDSWLRYLTRNNHIGAKFIINGESVSMGDNYLFDKLEQTNENMTVRITAKNYIRQLDNQAYIEARHGTDSLENALDELLSNTELAVKYTPQSKKSQTVSLSAPKDTTRRAAIHYYAQAVRTSCFLNRRNEIEIKAFDVTNYVDTFDDTNMYNNNIARMNDYVNMIRLTVKDEYVDPPFEQTYYGGSGLYYREIENHCVYPNDAQSVANWLLEQKKRRAYFEIESRGNPAIELGDTIQVVADDGSTHLAVVYYQNFEYNGGLKATMRAAGTVDVGW